jgi:hypothetical protein
MKYVRGFALALNKFTDVDVPVGSEIIGVQALDGNPHLFLLVDGRRVGSRRRSFLTIGAEYPVIDEEHQATCVGMLKLRGQSGSEAPHDIPYFVFEYEEPLTHTARRAVTETP